MSDKKNPVTPDDPQENEPDIVEAFLAEQGLVNETVNFEDVPEGHRSGYVAVVGRPNVGKSTLINALLGQKLNIVSPKPQTTRVNQLGILTEAHMQVVFVDTPGIHRAQNKLGEFMVQVAVQALHDANIIVFVSDLSAPINRADHNVADMIRASKNAIVLRVLNKVDQAPAPEDYRQRVDEHLGLIESTAWCTTVAPKGKGVPELLALIQKHLPEGPRYYPKDQVSDLWIREIVTEMIREAVLLFTNQEVPHAVAVYVEEYKERENGVVYINATIYVERDGQKAIIIGKQGRMIRNISRHARQEIENMLDTKIFLDLRVKVLKNWRSDENALRRFGYRIDRN